MSRPAAIQPITGSLFALLVSNCARSLTSRLTGSLALAAAALFSCFLEVSRIDGLDVLHNKILH